MPSFARGVVLYIAATLMLLVGASAASAAVTFEPAADSPLVGVTTEPGDIAQMPVDYAISDMTTGHFNNDVYEDIAVVSDVSHQIYVYLGNQDGTLDPSASNPVGDNYSVPGLFLVQALDIDGDGADDLITGAVGSPTTLQIYRNRMVDFLDVHERFETSPSATPVIGDAFTPDYKSASFGDVGADGDTDMVLGLEGHSWTLLTHNSGSTLSIYLGKTVNSNDPTATISSTALGDYDGDGRADLAMVMAEETASHLLFAKDQSTNPGVANFAQLPEYVESAGPNERYNQLKTIDLNGDVYEDLVYTFRGPEDQSLRTALGSPTGLTAGTGTGAIIELPSPNEPSVGDYSGDGADDVAVPEFVDDRFDLAVNDGDGKLALDPAGPFDLPAIGGLNFRPQGSDPLDLNGDGLTDFAAYGGHFDPMQNQPAGVQIMLNVPTPGISVDPASVDFGSVPEDAELIAPKTVTVTSDGTKALTLEDMSVTGPDANRFQASGGTCAPGELEAFESCTVELTLIQSGGEGPLEATLEIPSDATEGPIQVPLAATITPHGDPPPPPPGDKAALSLKLKSAKKVKRGKTLVVKATVKNTGKAAASALTVRATVPKKLAKAVKAIKVPNLAAGKSVTRKIKVRVRKSAKKGKKLKVKVRAGAPDFAAAKSARVVRIR